MQTATATMNKSFDSVDMSRLPMFMGVDTAKIMEGATDMSTPQKRIYNTLRLLVFGALGYGLWVYALPPFFAAFGQFAGIAAGITLLAALVVFRGTIFRWLKHWSRSLDKALIRKAPFEEFEKAKQEMIANKQEFYQKTGNMVKIEKDMKSYAIESEEQAQMYQEQITQKRGELEKIRTALAAVTDKESPEYTDLLNKADRLHAEANGLVIRYEQAQQLTQKYGVRAQQFGKLNRKLSRVANHMDIKIMNFDNTVFMLKQDFEFAKNSAESTSAVKKAMLFENSWELEYATEFVHTAITSYISTTKMNMKDLDSLTNNFNIDDDSIFNKIDKLSARIDSGEEKLVAAKSYNNPDKVLTDKEMAVSGGFGNIGF